MLQAMNTGHEGSLATIHANTPRDAHGASRDDDPVRGHEPAEQARCASRSRRRIDVIVQVSRMADGSRRIVSITEVTGMEGEIITMQEIFRYHRRGIAHDGTVIGGFESDRRAADVRGAAAAGRRGAAARPVRDRGSRCSC